MVKIYNCEYCKFQTPIKTNFSAHISSLKHIEYINKHCIKCEYCLDNIKLTEIDLHYSVCSNKILVDKVVNSKIGTALNAAIIKLENEYDAKLTKLCDIHNTKIATIKRKNYSSINYQIKKQTNAYTNLKLKHEKEIDKIKKEYTENLDYFTKEITIANSIILNAKNKQIVMLENLKKRTI
jgi:hypothetical protein